MIRIIGFSGRAGAGKSTAARRLVEAHGFVRRPFAGPLKDMLRALLRAQGASEPYVAEALDGARKEAPSAFLAGCTPRQAMQTLGTEWGRALSADFWLEAWRNTLPAEARIVVDDVRFANEAAAIAELGGEVWRIERPGAGLEGAAALHASERGDFAADGAILNAGSRSEFFEAVARLA